VPATLLTGGAGFVGLNLAEALLGRGETVVCFDRRPPPAAARRALGSLPGRLVVVEGDVGDAAAVGAAARAHGAARLVHAAAVTAGLERERRDAAAVARVNVLGTLAVLDGARQARIGRIVHVSSGAVFGAAGFGPEALDEEAPVAPETVYAVTKYAGERLALRAAALHGLDLVVARLGSVFGRWEHDSGVRDTPSAPLQAVRLAEAGRTAVLPRPGWRDWVYAPDVAAGLVALLDHPRPAHRLYHVGSGVRWSVEAWCARLAARFPGFAHRPARAPEEATVDLYGDRDRAPLAIGRLAADTGFRPRWGLDEAFEDYLAWRARHGTAGEA